MSCGYVNVDVPVDVPLDQVAEVVVFESDEASLLDAMADANANVERQSGHDEEKAFAALAAAKLRELAAWFREKQL